MVRALVSSQADTCLSVSDSPNVGRKKPTGKNAKVQRDENTKNLTEVGEWARDEVTMDRVAKSVLLYSFIKDGQARGERVDTNISRIESGQTIKVQLNDFMFEEKVTKAGVEGNRNVFPSDVDVIPAFSVIEVALNPANSIQYDAGWGVNVARIRQCPFTLYSMLSPLGLDLLPSTHEQSKELGASSIEISPGLQRVVETTNTGFFGQVTRGSYLVEHVSGGFRLVGPKEDPTDPRSKHLDVMKGGIFAIDIAQEDLVRFTNGLESEEEDSVLYARFIVDLASSAGALACYVAHNEYLMRKDPNRSPFSGVPLIDSSKLLDCVSFAPSSPEPIPCRFPLPFSLVHMDSPHIAVDVACVDNNSAGELAQALPCPDFVLASRNAPVRYAYPLSFGDAVEDDIQSLLFVPKQHSCGGGSGDACGLSKRSTLEPADYRLLKRRRAAGSVNE